MPLSPAPPRGVARPCRSVAATVSPALPLLRAVCLVERTPAILAIASRPPLQPERPWAGEFPEPRENLRRTLLGPSLDGAPFSGIDGPAKPLCLLDG